MGSNPTSTPELTRLSVITPVFNGERFIEACLQSVFDQGQPGVEHLVMDGGSSDRTIDRVRAFAAYHPHVCWFSAKDRGQSDAMNRGLAAARGRIVSFLNADDLYLPGAFAEALMALDNVTAPAFVVGDCRVEDAEGHQLYLSRPQNLSVEDMLIARPMTTFPINPATYFYHREIHDRIGGFDCEEHQAMDIDFLLRAFAIVKPIYIARPWAIFRLHEFSKTGQEIDMGSLRSHKERIYKRYYRTLSLPRQMRCRTLKRYYEAVHGLRLARDNPAQLIRALRTFSRVRRL